MFKKLFIFSIIILAVSASESFSQTALNVKANLLVLDENDQYINDVAQEDIKIYEDGVEQQITYFAKKEPVLNLGIVVDNSGSMRLVLNDLALISSVIVNNLRPQDNAFFVRFVSRDKISVEQEWTSDKSKLNNTISNMFVEGGQTAITDALYLATKKLLEREKKNPSQRFALVLISDGEDRNSSYNLDQLFELYNKTDTQIFPFYFSQTEPKNQIKGTRRAIDKKQKSNRIFLDDILATETGGTAFTLSEKYDKTEIIDKLKLLIVELRSNYIINYDSTNPIRNGKIRKLTVRIANGKDGQKRIASIRKSFVVVDKNKK